MGERAAPVPAFLNKRSAFRKAQSRTWRWGGRVVEGGTLEKCYTGNGIVSSNLTPTAMYGKINRGSPAETGLLLVIKSEILTKREESSTFRILSNKHS